MVIEIPTIDAEQAGWGKHLFEVSNRSLDGLTWMACQVVSQGGLENRSMTKLIPTLGELVRNRLDLPSVERSSGARAVKVLSR